MAQTTSATLTPQAAEITTATDKKLAVKNPNKGGVFFDPARLSPPAKVNELTLTVQGIKAGQLVTENVYLKQGLNILPIEKVKLIQDNFPDHFSRGAVELVALNESLSQGAAMVLVSLADLSQEQATKTVAFERDRAVLNTWLGVELRPVVVRAINERITGLEKGASI